MFFPLDAVTAAIQRDEKRREQQKRLADLKAHFSSLTSREREIMALVASGLMSKQIAAQVGLSEITVKVHRSHIMKKMEARSVACQDGRSAGDQTRTLRQLRRLTFH
jgi:FixJ family two-component response regulator